MNWLGKWWNNLIKNNKFYGSVKIGRNTRILSDCIFHTSGNEVIEIGDNCVISHFVVIIGDVKIGNNSVLSPFAVITSRAHQTVDKVKKGSVAIGNNVLLGGHSAVFPGVTIGDNSVIGAFSLVNKSIPSNTVAFGIPCKIKESV